MKKRITALLMTSAMVMSFSTIAFAETDYSDQEPYTVRIYAVGNCTEEACNEVAAAVSEITEAKFNTTVELVRYPFSEYVDQVQTALVSGEKIDLMGGISDLSIASTASQGQVLALDELLESDGQGILADVSEEDFASTSIDGQIYAVRNNKELGMGVGYVFNTEMLESLGVDYSNIMTEADLEPILVAAHEKYPDVYPLISYCGYMQDYMLPIDWLGRDSFGVLLNAFDDENTEVVNFYTSEPYYELIKRRHDWNQRGLIMPDASINTETYAALLSAGKGFGASCETKPGSEAQWERDTGIDCTVIQIVDNYSSTSNLNNYWYVPYTSEQPERAMQILNEMYTNPDVANLFIYGVEGKYYEYVDKENDLIDYPEGVSADTLGWEISAWHFPNQLISHKWVTDGPDIWEETKAFNESCHQSPAKGFLFDSSSVTNEIVACKTVLAKYQNGLDTGDVDPDSVWDQMSEELDAAGINKIIDEKQRQLDEWIAANK